MSKAKYSDSKETGLEKALDGRCSIYIGGSASVDEAMGWKERKGSFEGKGLEGDGVAVFDASDTRAR